jgi:hypothetical protein
VTGGRWVPVADLVAASGWIRAVALTGVTIDLGVQAEADAETLRLSGADVRECVLSGDPAAGIWVEAGADAETLRQAGVDVRECVRAGDPAAAAWAEELDGAAARLRSQVRRAAGVTAG